MTCTSRATTPPRVADNMDADQLQQIMPKAPSDRAAAIVDTMPRWEIHTPAREAAFLAQLAHESVELTRVEENLNYSAQALMRTWPNRFPTIQVAQQFHRQPQKIANQVYASRMGNGGSETGDGWMYRGRGPIQLTGRANYKTCGAAIGHDLEHFPELVLRATIGAEVACWFWYSHGLNDLADQGAFEKITRIINGGLNGQAERVHYWEKAKAVLGVA